MHGQLWRDVVNLLGHQEPTPTVFLPLLEMVAGNYPDETCFTPWIGKHLSNDRDRVELDDDLRRADIAFSLWKNQRSALGSWASRSGSPLETEVDLRRWWFDLERPDRQREEEGERLQEFLDLVTFSPDEQAFLDGYLVREHFHDIFIYSLRRQLRWLEALSLFRSIAQKTWPAHSGARGLWDDTEFELVCEYYEDQQPLLIYDTKGDGGINPFSLTSAHVEQAIGFGCDGLDYCMTVLLRATIINFIDELLEYTNYPRARGSLQCLECGTFVGRRGLGYGQLYCGEQCKRRAAKRRYRTRLACLPITSA